MKLFLPLILLFSAPVSQAGEEEQTRTYFIMDLEKGGSTKKFEELFSRCGGRAVRQINDYSIMAEMSVQQGICVAESTRKIVIQMNARQ